VIEQRAKHFLVALLAALSGGVASSAAAQDALQAKAIDAVSLFRDTAAAVRLAGGLNVVADRSKLREGEALTLTIALPRAGYLNIVNIDSAGTPTVLFPNAVQSDNRVTAGTFTLPTPAMQFQIQVSAPFGTTTVAAFLTQDKLDLYADGDRVREVVATASGGGAAGATGATDTFARLSTLGRNLIDVLGTKSLAVVPTAPTPVAAPGASAPAVAAPAAGGAPMLAGMTVLLTCARTGPCDEPDDVSSSPLMRLLGAITPGILLEPASKDAGVSLRRIGDRGLLLTKASEGFVDQLYEDAAGYCSVAYGHLVRIAPCSRTDRRTYGRRIAEPKGSALLASDLARAERAVQKFVKVPLNDGQYDALCDFTYNVGSGALQHSTLLKVINAGDMKRVPTQFRRWTKAGGVAYRGLKTRRERELVLFFGGQPVPAAKSLGQPLEPDETPLDIRVGESGN
jgi:GH24 family phage-related lysozyme (muramidase)